MLCGIWLIHIVLWIQTVQTYWIHWIKLDKLNEKERTHYLWLVNTTDYNCQTASITHTLWNKCPFWKNLSKLGLFTRSLSHTRFYLLHKKAIYPRNTHRELQNYNCSKTDGEIRSIWQCESISIFMYLRMFKFKEL